jgi:cytochrome c oxidase subunit 5b
MAQETRPGLAPPPAKNVDHEHATGLELRELQAAAEGKDFFDHYDFLQAVRRMIFSSTRRRPVFSSANAPHADP